jgi:tetratricopeptide (TPR) repeat protein
VISLLLMASLVAQASPAAQKATAARVAGRLDEAVAQYNVALKQTPAWAEGWFFLGSIYYERDQAAPCVAAFRNFVRLQPKTSAGFAFLGLCLYQLKDYGNSLQSLLRAQELGVPNGEQLTNVASYHAALLFTKAENFEKALRILQIFSRDKGDFDPKIIEAAGNAALRRPLLPEELKDEDRELVYRVGRAVMTAADRRSAEAARLLAEVVADYPQAPNVHYVYGSLLLGGDSAQGIAMLQKELELQPGHLPSLVLLALEYLTRGEPALARQHADRAARLAPGNFAAHTALGRALTDLGEIPAAITELELARKLEPTSPQVRIALASAYQKAGRPQDASRERAEFLRLKKLLEGGN